jgi:hypothetical protein
MARSLRPRRPRRLLRLAVVTTAMSIPLLVATDQASAASRRSSGTSARTSSVVGGFCGAWGPLYAYPGGPSCS